MAEETRSFKLTGSAAQAYNGEDNLPKKRPRRKKQEGGEMAESAGSPDPATWLKAPLTPVPSMMRPVIQVAMHPNVPAVPIVPTVATVPTMPIVDQSGGTVKHIKVELKKRVTTHKVKLQPKKEVLKKKVQSKKVRKITMGVKSLHKRMTRAKKVQRNVTEMPLEKLKELLVSKKLIKANSKAPESILRQIAADSQLVANKIL